MPKYFFDVQDDDGVFVDEVGLELPDMQAAIREARRALADMVRDSLREPIGDGLSIAIRDGADGPMVLTVTLTTASPPGQTSKQGMDGRSG
jgi:hypothetical protein